MKPYFSDPAVTLWHGDCLEVMRDMSDESVDIIVTSPPYNMGLVPGGNGRGMYRPGASNKAGRFRDGYGQHDDAMVQEEYDAWQREVLAECWRVARLAVFYNHRPRVEHGVLRDPLSNDFGIPLRQRIIWNRRTGIDVNLRTFCTRGEYILFFAKPEMKLASHAASGMGDVWDLGIEYAVKDHPAPFPVSLPTRCIEATAAQSVLDPFCGSGTTLRAASDLHIKGYGIELETKFCDLTVSRLRQGALDFGEHGTDSGGRHWTHPRVCSCPPVPGGVECQTELDPECVVHGSRGEQGSHLAIIRGSTPAQGATPWWAGKVCAFCGADARGAVRVDGDPWPLPSCDRGDCPPLHAYLDETERA